MKDDFRAVHHYESLVPHIVRRRIRILPHARVLYRVVLCFQLGIYVGSQDAGDVVQG